MTAFPTECLLVMVFKRNQRAGSAEPNGTEEIDVGSIEFDRLGRSVEEGRFDDGSMTSEGGAVLLGQVDRKLEQLEEAARCIADPRSPCAIDASQRRVRCR